MAIKVGMTVRTVRAVAGLAKDGAVDLAEGAKGTVLEIVDDTAFLSRKDGEAVFVSLEALAGCKGRPMKAEGLAAALRKARGEAEPSAPEADASTETASAETSSESTSEDVASA